MFIMIKYSIMSHKIFRSIASKTLTIFFDVDFEFFDPKEIDFQTIKQLMIQLFSSDAEL